MNHSITVHCPSCSHAFPLNEGVLSSVRQDLSRELQGDITRREQQLAERQEALRDQQAEMKRHRAELDEQVEALVEQRLTKELASVQAKAEEKAARHAAAQQELAVKELQMELSDKAEALKKAQAQELELRAEKRRLQEAKEAFALESQRKLDQEREKIRQESQKLADEENRLKIAEKEKLITELQAKIKDAQRKAEQGCVQNQGEVYEIDFENQLQQAFPLDNIQPVSTGVRGADLSQEVMSRTGRSCGTILFENKRTRNWNENWITKLKSDLREARADIGVLVTETLPKGIDRFGQKDGIWVTDFASAIPLAHALRASLHEVMVVKGHQEGAKEKMQLLYDYLTGNEFRQRVQVVIDAFTAMRDDLEKERRALTKYWNKREKQLNVVVENMSGMVGDVQGLSGETFEALPALELDSENDEHAA